MNRGNINTGAPVDGEMQDTLRVTVETTPHVENGQEGNAPTLAMAATGTEQPPDTFGFPDSVAGHAQVAVPPLLDPTHR